MSLHCEKCAVDFSSATRLSQHLKSKKHNDYIDDMGSVLHIESQFKCHDCNIFFTGEDVLQVHMKTESHRTNVQYTLGIDPIYECKDCNKTFATKNHLHKHMQTKVHTTEKHECDICNKLMGSANSLQIHIKDFHKTVKHTCDLCEKDFFNKASLKQHMENGKHEKYSDRFNITEVDGEKVYSIFLRDENGVVVNETVVDEEIYYHIIEKKYTVYHDDGYAVLVINEDDKTRYNMKLHLYIYYVYHQFEKTKEKLDHKNKKPMNNKLENLREATNGENSRNRTKKKNATSPYQGVYFNDSKWRMTFCHGDIRISRTYDIETWASYHYDLLSIQYGLTEWAFNGTPEPEGFKIKEEKVRDLPFGVSRNRSKYVYSIGNSKSKVFDTVEEASVARQKEVERINTEKENMRLNTPILRNSDGIAIIELHNKAGDKVGETLVDDDMYYELTKYSWHFAKKGYVCGTINGKDTKMSIFIINCPKDKKADHINSIKTDHRRANLRPLTSLENAQNKSSAKNSSSPYIGVSYNQKLKQWRASIVYKNEEQLGKMYKTQLEAVTARDNKARELNKEHNAYYKINIPIDN